MKNIIFLVSLIICLFFSSAAFALRVDNGAVVSSNIATNLPDNVVLDNEENTFTTGQTFTDVTANSIVSTDLSITGTPNITGGLIVDTNTLYVDSETNKVGVGTANPTEKLEVHEGSIKAISTTESGYISITDLSAVEQVRLESDGGDSWIATGDVGIGTDSPSFKLDIVGECRMATLNFTSDVATAAATVSTGSIDITILVNGVPYDLKATPKI